MTAQIVGLAEAIRGDLVAASAANAFVLPLTTVARRWHIVTRVADLPAGQHVTLAHAADEGNREMAAGPFQRRIAIRLRLLAKIDPAGPETPLDTLAELVEQLGDFFQRRQPTGRGESLIACDILQVYSPDDLAHHGVFCSIQELAFFAWR